MHWDGPDWYRRVRDSNIDVVLRVYGHGYGYVCMTSSMNPSIKAAAWLAWLVSKQEGTKRHGMSCYASTHAMSAVNRRAAAWSALWAVRHPTWWTRMAACFPRQGGHQSKILVDGAVCMCISPCRCTGTILQVGLRMG